MQAHGHKLTFHVVFAVAKETDCYCKPTKSLRHVLHVAEWHHTHARVRVTVSWYKTVGGFDSAVAPATIELGRSQSAGQRLSLPVCCEILLA